MDYPLISLVLIHHGVFTLVLGLVTAFIFQSNAYRIKGVDLSKEINYEVLASFFEFLLLDDILVFVMKLSLDDDVLTFLMTFLFGEDDVHVYWTVWLSLQVLWPSIAPYAVVRVLAPL